jgi:hypothetical protein
MDNPSGYTQSRAGDETLGWNDSQGENAGTVHFTADEQKLLAEIGGRKPGLVSAQVSAWNSVRRPVSAGLVPVDPPQQEPFPLFSDEVEPW